MFPTIKTYYEQIKKNSEFDEFSRKLKKNIERLVLIEKKYSWEDEADVNFREAVAKAGDNHE